MRTNHRLQPLRRKINYFYTSNRATRISTKFRPFPLVAEYYCRTCQNRSPKIRTIVVQFYHKANCFYNQSNLSGRTSQNYTPITDRNAEKQDRKFNKKEGEEGVTLSRPAELSKHLLKALIAWKHAHARLRRGRGRSEATIGHIVIDNGCGYHKTLWKYGPVDEGSL
jgi:hypothetical protein